MSRKFVIFTLIIFSLLSNGATFGQEFTVSKNADSVDFEYVVRQTRDMMYFESDSIFIRLYEIPFITETGTSKDEIWYDLLIVVKEAIYPKITEGLFIISRKNNLGFNDPKNYHWNPKDSSISLDYLEKGKKGSLTIMISGASVSLRQ
jgi:hypothetical protein